MRKAYTAVVREDSLEKVAVGSSQLVECMMEREGREEQGVPSWPGGGSLKT